MSLIPISDCESAAAAKRPFVVCAAGNHTVEVRDIAPDITLNGVHVPMIEESELSVGEEVGSGGWGIVYRAQYCGKSLQKVQHLTNVEYGSWGVKGTFALKKFQLAAFSGPNMQQDVAKREMYLEFQREVSINGSLSHPKLVEMLGMVMDPSFGILMEFMNAGDLYKFIHDHTNELPWSRRIEFALDIAEGMRFLHSLKLLHQDLKSPNVLLNRSGDKLVAKIADFGLARETESVAVGRSEVVNPTWLAPEVIQGARPTLKVLSQYLLLLLLLLL